MKHFTLAGLSCWCPTFITLILLSLSLPIWASPPLQTDEQHQLTGAVTDQAGLPLPGVNILVKNTQNGTMSDADGKYNIMVSHQDTLVYSYVGFKTREERVGDRLTIDVVLQEDVASLDEVVVNAGYYTVSEKERTGSISRITSEDIEKQPVSNPLAAMQGRMPGVEIVQTTGVPGGGFQVRIRGQNSIAAGNDPLYIVDGVPFTSESVASLGQSIIHPVTITPLTAINPADIESIEVLKDADATAIYGSRGANGVVLITTKKGKAGKTSVEVNMQTGVGRVANTMKLLNTQQYLEMRREAFSNDDETPTESTAPDLLLWDPNRYTDWQKELIGGTAYTTDARLSVSGGSENTRFSVRGGYYKETTVFPGDFDYRRMSLHSNLNHTSANEKFGISLTMGFTREESDLFNSDLTQNALTLPPNVPDFLDGQGNLLFPTSGLQIDNPWIFAKMKYNKDINTFISNVILNYDILPGFQAKANLGYTRMRSDEIQVRPQSSIDPETTTAIEFSDFAYGNLETWIAEPRLEYQKAFGKGILTLLVGSTFQENIGRNQVFRATGFTSDTAMEDIGSASDVVVQNSGAVRYAYHAVFGRMNYAWDGKYIVNLTGRRDGSSRFGPDRQFANFGAIGIAWIFSQENFVKKTIPFLSFGKLRASYGNTGNDQIGDYQFLDTYSSTIYPYLGNTGLYPTRLFNPNFGWERNRKFEGALELGLLNDKILFNIGYYLNRSDNQLVGQPLPPSTGFTTIQSNLQALVQNTGWEFELKMSNVSSEDFTWETAVNLAVPRNKLLEYSSLESSVFANRYQVGKSLFVQKKFHYTNVDPLSGVYQFEDVDVDGMVTYPNDIQALYEVKQDFFGGMNNHFSYKNWNLDIFFQFVKQIGRNYQNHFMFAPGFISNQAVAVLNRWQEEGDVTNIQKFTQRSSQAGRAYSIGRGQGDYIFEQTSFIRLKSLSLSYHLPTQNTPFQNLRIYLQGQNLLTITNHSGLDPENNNNSLPPLRVITAGIHFTL